MLVTEGMHRNFLTAIAKLANISMQTGKFPSRYKQAQVLPLLKKAGLDRSSPKNYRPLHLSTVLKILERLLLTRLRPHLLELTNFNKYQSAYRKRHSTETALLEIFDGVYTAADDKQVTVLISLDLSAAFDTVDHEVLLQRLQSEFGVTDTPLFWLRSYLESRTQFVKLGQHHSPAVGLDVGVPQGSVLGPLLFAVYCSPAAPTVEKKQESDQTVLTITKVLTKTTYCTRRAKNLNNFLYKNKSGTPQ